MKDEAKIYEKMNLLKKFLSAEKPQSIKDFLCAEEKIIKNLGKVDDNVLDAGCGFGRHLKLISHNIKKGIGIDYDSKAIKDAKTNTKRIRNLEFYVASIYDIPFPDNFFGLILCLNHTFGNLPKHKPAIKEMLRVLRPGGKIILTVHNNKIKDDKIIWYKNTGLKKPTYSEKSGLVTTEEKFYSYCFKKSYLSDIFKQFKNTSFSISDLTLYSFLCTINKKK
jgi:2-polyprenyl-6-hydroxyphenyl methylase/3-demethylubiquinone-9 3-methyltransferase